MPKLDRYLFSELAQSTFAVLVVLLIVSMGAVLADVLRDITSGRVPAGLLLAQIGLQFLNYLPIILPLALLLGLMLGVGRLYRDSEMPVITAAGVGPRRLLRPVMMLVLPVVAIIAVSSLWLGPMAERISKQMISDANRNLLVAGLEPGRFTELPGGGVVYVGSMSGDGTRFQRVFIHRQNAERMDITTSNTGRLTVHPDGERFITLEKGFQVEGPRNDGLGYRLLRYASNDVRLPPGEGKFDPRDPEVMSTFALLRDDRREANAQVHARLAPPLLALAFALLAVPLSRTSPRQARYGHLLMGFLGFVVATSLMLMARGWLEDGKLPPAAGMWWLVLPLLALGIWMDARDGQPRGLWGRR